MATLSILSRTLTPTQTRRAANFVLNYAASGAGRGYDAMDDDDSFDHAARADDNEGLFLWDRPVSPILDWRNNLLACSASLGELYVALGGDVFVYSTDSAMVHNSAYGNEGAVVHSERCYEPRQQRPLKRVLKAPMTQREAEQEDPVFGGASITNMIVAKLGDVEVLACATGEQVVLWYIDAPAASAVIVPMPASAWGLDVHERLRLLAVGCNDHAIHVIDLRTGHRLRFETGHNVPAVSFGPTSNSSSHWKALPYVQPDGSTHAIEESEFMTVIGAAISENAPCYAELTVASPVSAGDTAPSMCHGDELVKDEEEEAEARYAYELDIELSAPENSWSLARLTSWRGIELEEYWIVVGRESDLLMCRCPPSGYVNGAWVLRLRDRHEIEYAERRRRPAVDASAHPWVPLDTDEFVDDLDYSARADGILGVARRNLMHWCAPLGLLIVGEPFSGAVDGYLFTKPPDPSLWATHGNNAALRDRHLPFEDVVHAFRWTPLYMWVSSHCQTLEAERSAPPSHVTGAKSGATRELPDLVRESRHGEPGEAQIAGLAVTCDESLGRATMHVLHADGQLEDVVIEVHFAADNTTISDTTHTLL